MNGALQGRTAVLTGVGRPGQVGEVVAQTFARAGARLVLVDRTPDEVAARAAELRSLGAEVAAYDCDLSDVAAVDTLARTVGDAAPNGIHALVCLAGGFAMSGPVAESDPAVFHKMLAINLTTAYLTTRAFLPALRSTRGGIVYFSAAAVLAGTSGAKMFAYAAAKSGVAALMRAVAAEEAEAGVRANALAPTAIRTATNEQSMSGNTRYVEREQVAEITLYLCSDAAHAITGQLIRLDA
ncbi:MAG TPA: SDR family oxidoreductase [Gemmatimonadaceae bacterium]|nr:SDR family oxidoreductase [Gemmatimonadaceae bacterium]